jgi:hypothetical protein
MITVSQDGRARAPFAGIALVVFAGRALWVARVGNAARLLAGAAAAWPAAHVLGVSLLALGFATHPGTADEGASVAGS